MPTRRRFPNRPVSSSSAPASCTWGVDSGARPGRRRQTGPDVIYCRVLASRVRVRVRATGLSTYPDVTVVSGGAETRPDDRRHHDAWEFTEARPGDELDLPGFDVRIDVGAIFGAPPPH